MHIYIYLTYPCEYLYIYIIYIYVSISICIFIYTCAGSGLLARHVTTESCQKCDTLCAQKDSVHVSKNSQKSVLQSIYISIKVVCL